MIDVVQAFDRELIDQLPGHDRADLEAKLVTATRIFKDRGGWLKPYQRIEILMKLADLLGRDRERFARLIAREGGKPLVDALVEVDRAINGIRSAMSCVHHMGGREVPMGLTAASTDRRAWTTAEPIGVVAAIAAFNHPLNLVVHQLAPAIAAGCPIIIKPATATPLNCLELFKLAHEAGMPEGWIQTFVSSSRELSEMLATDARISFLSFIGSAKVGWYLRSKLPPGTRCALEHGGVAPLIVDKSADLARFVEPIVKGGYYHAGQVCVSTQRIYVHEAIANEFLELFSSRVAQLVTGDPLSPQTEVGPLIQPAEVNRVSEWIDEAVGGGARMIGGGRLSETTLLPVILVEPPKDSKVATLEAFGPITCLFTVRSLDEAIRYANSLPVAFQSSIFTQDIHNALHAAEALDASAVMINDHTAFRTDWMPFAGRHSSGYGVGGIPYTTREMSAEKMTVFRM
ncbi:aldehyde dehydrogenase family protein [Rhizobium lentis]|uniref:Aldehyde dehydrogenase family protein n=1 Tax=Rhizobium lentis TaxID=1138194 RepID=A0ABS7IB67_9HYPH|nr:aldehyde dehydrogenase family protein [Rhizobium lentis]